MPWSQGRDAANGKHMTGCECSHLNNSGVGGRQRGDAITAGLSLTEVQSSQHFLKTSDTETQSCAYTQICKHAHAPFFFCHLRQTFSCYAATEHYNNKLWHSSDTWKSPVVFQKELWLNLTGPEPSRGGERTIVTFWGKKKPGNKPNSQACPPKESKREREWREREGRVRDGEKQRKRERGRGRKRVREAKRRKDTKLVTWQKRAGTRGR